MPVPKTIIPAKPRRQGKRHPVSAPPAPPGPVEVSVASVANVDGESALWTFSAPVVAISDVTGLLVAGMPPGEVIGITPEGALRLGYDEGVMMGDPWIVNADAALTFASGGTLRVPESGNVE